MLNGDGNEKTVPRRDGTLIGTTYSSLPSSIMLVTPTLGSKSGIISAMCRWRNIYVFGFFLKVTKNQKFETA